MNKIIFLSLFIFTSCEINFGDKVKDFVNKEVPGLSKKMAISGIERRLYEGKFLSLVEMTLEARVLQRSLSKIEINSELLNTSIDSNSGLKVYSFYYGQETKVLRHLADLSELKKRRDAFIDICDEGNENHLQDLVNAEAFNIAIPKEEYTIAIYSNWIETIVQNVGSLFTGQNTAKQAGIMQEAISKIPQKIVSQEELEKIFRSECIQIDNKLNSQNIAAVNKNYLGEIEKLAWSRLELIQKIKKQAVALYYQYRKNEILSKTGFDDEQRISLDFEKTLKRYKELSRALSDAKEKVKNSEEKYSLEENLNEFLRAASFNKTYISSMQEKFYSAELELKNIDNQIAMMKLFYKLKLKAYGGINE